MPPKHKGGGCTCCRPCCAVVWDYVRDDYGNWSQSLHGVTFASDPIVTNGTFYETYVAGGVTYYSCSQVNTNQETSTTAPSGSGSYRREVDTSLDPGTGATIYRYSYSEFLIDVTVCEPSAAIRVKLNIYYAAFSSSDPSGTITGAGYVLDATWAGAGDRYQKFVGDITHYVIVEAVTGGYKSTIISEYLATITTAANIMSAVPNPLTVTPAYNPFTLYAEVVFS